MRAAMYALQLIRGNYKTRTQARVFSSAIDQFARTAPVSRPHHFS